MSTRLVPYRRCGLESCAPFEKRPSSAWPAAVEHVQNAIEKAKSWLLHSGIQREDGGVARFHRVDSDESGPVSTEITGYLASGLAFLRGCGCAQLKRSADFLVEEAWDVDECFLRYEPGTAAGQRACSYFFDCGIAGLALVQYWELTGDRRYLKSALEIGRSMLVDFPASNGAFTPVITLPGKEPMPYGAWWSKAPGCYQLKAALLWLRLSECVDEHAFGNAFRKVMAYAVEDSESFLSGPADDKMMDRLHAFLYFLEGLLPLAGERAYGQLISRGLASATGVLRKMTPAFVRSDVCAQLVRLRLFAHEAARLPLDADSVDREIQKLLAFQFKSADTRINGAFCFGSRAGVLLPYANPVSTVFAAQALAFWLRFRSGQLSHDWRTVI